MSFTSRSYMQKSVGQKTMSVYGGAGGYGTRISTPLIGNSSYLSNSGGSNLTDGLDLHVDANEKAMLQNLNDRLASYLEKVRKLEKENEQLEKQIREWYTSKTVITHDHTGYMATIADLQDKIRAAAKLNARLFLEFDNSRLASDDFKLKYENELNMRQAVESDIAGLRRVSDYLNLTKMDLESQFESLKDELIMLKRNHEEEITQQKSQIGGKFIVEIDAPAPTELSQVMKEIRQHYEAVIAKNHKELELWYQKKITPVEGDVGEKVTSIGSFRLEIKELKSTLQRLQIDLQSQLSMKSSLEATLRETQEQFAARLSGLQVMVTGLEAQMETLTVDMENMKQMYGTLLDLKTRLEAEIVEYRRLLDGEDDSSKQVIKKTIMVQETVVDGKVVTSTKTVDVDVVE